MEVYGINLDSTTNLKTEKTLDQSLPPVNISARRVQTACGQRIMYQCMYMEKENLHFYAHENAFRGLVYTPDVFLVNLEVAGKSYKAVMKEIQFHPVSDRLQHIDFMQVSEDKPVTIDIPLKITGESSGVKAGGKLRVKRRN